MYKPLSNNMYYYIHGIFNNKILCNLPPNSELMHTVSYNPAEVNCPFCIRSERYTLWYIKYSGL